jgi:hypothetical protein
VTTRCPDIVAVSRGFGRWVDLECLPPVVPSLGVLGHEVDHDCNNSIQDTAAIHPLPAASWVWILSRQMWRRQMWIYAFAMAGLTAVAHLFISSVVTITYDVVGYPSVSIFSIDVFELVVPKSWFWMIPPGSLVRRDMLIDLSPATFTLGPFTYYVLPMWCAYWVRANGRNGLWTDLHFSPVGRWRFLLAQVWILGAPFWIAGVTVSLLAGLWPTDLPRSSLSCHLGLTFNESPCFPASNWILLATSNAVVGVCVGTWLRGSPWAAAGITMLLMTAWTLFQLAFASSDRGLSLWPADPWILVSTAVLTLCNLVAVMIHIHHFGTAD